jgi:transcriptional regulator with XRE-family HTH domain
MKGTRYRFDGQALRRLRMAAGLRVEHLALDTGRTAQTIDAYEAGRIVPPVAVVSALCESIGCGPEDLLRPIPQPDPAAVTAGRKRSRRAQGLPEDLSPAELDEAAELLRATRK